MRVPHLDNKENLFFLFQSCSALGSISCSFGAPRRPLLGSGEPYLASTRPGYVSYDKTELPMPVYVTVISEPPSVDHARDALGSDLARDQQLDGAEARVQRLDGPKLPPQAGTSGLVE